MQRMSRLFARTLRDDPVEATIVSHRLLLRAGYIRPLGAGIYSMLPLGWRVQRRVEQIVREEMDRIGCQELLMPVVHPSDLWERTGRFHSVGSEMARLKDRWGRDMVLAMTHEEVATDLGKWVASSYRQLPLCIYHFQTKFRDEPRPRGGLLRVREFTMKDAYSFNTDLESQEATYQDFMTAYLRAFRRCGIEPAVVESDAGAMQGSGAHEFHCLTEAGEDTLVVSASGRYAANIEIAKAQKPVFDHGEPQPVEKVATPGQETIDDVAAYLGVATHQTLKAVFYWTGDALAFVAIRGDLQVNEAKLRSLLQAPDLRLAADQELEAAGLVAGYASPVGLSNVTLVVDDSVESATNLVAGANEPGFHLTNVNYPRDFQADLRGDIAQVRSGDRSIEDDEPLELMTGIEIGNTFKLGTFYSDKLDAQYLAADGRRHPFVMGSYGIGIGRLAASVVERYHDADGIIWPVSVAPYDVHIVQLGAGDVAADAERLAEELEAAGLSVVLDDRGDSAGVKFNDADLIGLPFRLTVSRRTLAASAVEFKPRAASERQSIPRDQIVNAVLDARAAAIAALTPDAPVTMPPLEAAGGAR